MIMILIAITYIYIYIYYNHCDFDARVSTRASREGAPRHILGESEAPARSGEGPREVSEPVA